jgi:hypothetical protein
MANGTVNFRLHANNPDQVDNSQKIEIPVLGPGAVNLLVIYTGTAIVNWDWEMLGSDTAIVQIVLEEDFDSKYGRPLGSDRPIVAPTFLAVSSEASKSPAFAPQTRITTTGISKLTPSTGNLLSWVRRPRQGPRCRSLQGSRTTRGDRFTGSLTR